jgi:putative selenate reductase molybdopterin-binding subunit
MQAGQGEPEPSPHDRRLLNLKARHLGDRVAAVIAETLEAAIEARDKVVVDWEVLPAVFTVEEAIEIAKHFGFDIEGYEGDPYND